MNEVDVFARLRPGDEGLDAATSDRIWSTINGTAPLAGRVADENGAGLASSATISVVDLDETANVDERSRRRFAVLGAAAAVVIGVAGLVVLQPSTSTTPSVATQPDIPEAVPTTITAVIPATTVPDLVVPVTTVPEFVLPTTTVLGEPIPSTTVPNVHVPVTTVPNVVPPTTAPPVDGTLAPQLAFDVDGWTATPALVEGRLIRYRFDHADGRQLEVTIQSGGVRVYLDRVSEFSSDVVEVLGDVSQVADLATTGRYQFDAVIEPDGDWVVQAVGTDFVDRADFVTAVAAFEYVPPSNR